MDDNSTYLIALFIHVCRRRGSSNTSTMPHCRDSQIQISLLETHLRKGNTSETTWGQISPNPTHETSVTHRRISVSVEIDGDRFSNGSRWKARYETFQSTGAVKVVLPHPCTYHPRHARTCRWVVFWSCDPASSSARMWSSCPLGRLSARRYELVWLKGGDASDVRRHNYCWDGGSDAS